MLVPGFSVSLKDAPVRCMWAPSATISRRCGGSSTCSSSCHLPAGGSGCARTPPRVRFTKFDRASGRTAGRGTSREFARLHSGVVAGCQLARQGTSGGAGNRSRESGLSGSVIGTVFEVELALDRLVARERVVVDLEHDEAALRELDARARRERVHVVPGAHAVSQVGWSVGAGEPGSCSCCLLRIVSPKQVQPLPLLFSGLSGGRPVRRDQEQDRVVHLGRVEVAGDEVARDDERVLRDVRVDSEQ